MRACVRAYVRVYVVSRVQNVSDSWGPGLEEISVIIIMRLFMQSLSLLVVYIRQ